MTMPQFLSILLVDIIDDLMLMTTYYIFITNPFLCLDSSPLRKTSVWEKRATGRQFHGSWYPYHVSTKIYF